MYSGHGENRLKLCNVECRREVGAGRGAAMYLLVGVWVVVTVGRHRALALRWLAQLHDAKNFWSFLPKPANAP